MIKPIILTEHNEVLKPLVDVKKDSEELSFCIGWHLYCNGSLDIMVVSNTHKAIRCNRCGLRVVIPSGVKTYGDLKRHTKATLGG